MPAGAIEPAPTTEMARLVLTERHPAQAFDYVDFSGELQRIGPETAGGAPLLINLWASWCPHCRAELNEFAGHWDQLSAKGLRILALSTEGVTGDGSRPDISDAVQLVRSSNFPFQTGTAGANGLRVLTVLHNQSFTRERPLPLPTSFLIDRNGRLAVL
ncbi:MAG: TlpA family protein disulfide reductase, partial [Akkermansiaceae bacterium]|nr:TlpA family protein disulfide reductase [Akkermansiaceae bacterium]